MDNYLPEHVAYKLNLNFRNKKSAEKMKIANGTLFEVTQDKNAEFQPFDDEKNTPRTSIF